jgi:hypothetical protein
MVNITFRKCFYWNTSKFYWNEFNFLSKYVHLHVRLSSLALNRHTMEGSVFRFLHVLNVGARWRWVISFTVGPLETHSTPHWAGSMAGREGGAKRKIGGAPASHPHNLFWVFPVKSQFQGGELHAVHCSKFLSDFKKHCDEDCIIGHKTNCSVSQKGSWGSKVGLYVTVCTLDAIYYRLCMHVFW